MIIHHSNATTDHPLMPCAATVGFFDGVHAGHRYLLAELCRVARQRSLAAAAFTFPIPPRAVLQPDFRPELLNTFDEKLDRLASTGIDRCVVLDFTPALAALSAREFISLLAERWQVRTLLTGYDHRFGRNRSEGFDDYVRHGSELGVEVVRASLFEAADATPVSSSAIRRLLSEGRVDEAAQLLTAPYRIQGHVGTGHRIGRTLGFPTANIVIADPRKVIPAQGVYVVWVSVAGRRYKGMLSIGSRPTFDGATISVEVHLLHFTGNLYDAPIAVDFVRRLRDNRRFDSPEALRLQLTDDCRQTDELLPG